MENLNALVTAMFNGFSGKVKIFYCFNPMRSTPLLGVFLYNRLLKDFSLN